MAINEHKNLNDANLHVPKGFEAASNDSIMTKNSGGSLEWLTKLNIKQDIISLRGFMNPGGSTNYWFPSAMTDTKAAFEFAEDYGATSITAATDITVSKAIRSSIYAVDQDCDLGGIYGWVNGDVTETVTFALVKLTPTADTSDAFEVGAATNTMTILDEYTASTYGSNNKIGLIDENAFTVTSIEQGDLLLPLVKSAGGSNDLYFNMSIKLQFTN